MLLLEEVLMLTKKKEDYFVYQHHIPVCKYIHKYVCMHMYMSVNLYDWIKYVKVNVDYVYACNCKTTYCTYITVERSLK